MKRNGKRVTAAAYDPEQKAKDLDDARRGFNSFLKFYIACPTKACKRARGCRGDVVVCRDRWWPHVPEELKVQLQTIIRVRNEGGSKADIIRESAAAVARWREYEVQSQRQDAERAPPAMDDAPDAADEVSELVSLAPAARVRLL